MAPRSSLAERPQLAPTADEVPLAAIFTEAIAQGDYAVTGDVYHQLMPVDDPAMVQTLLTELTTALAIERQHGAAERSQRLVWGIQALLWPKHQPTTEQTPAGYTPARARAIQRGAGQASMATAHR